MIQRIQSLYMLVSTILGVVCLSLPLGKFFNEFGEQVSTLYNLWLHTCDKDAYSFAPWALFAFADAHSGVLHHPHCGLLRMASRLCVRVKWDTLL